MIKLTADDDAPARTQQAAISAAPAAAHASPAGVQGDTSGGHPRDLGTGGRDHDDIDMEPGRGDASTVTSGTGTETQFTAITT